MSLLAKTVNFIIKRPPLLCGLLLASILALSPAPAAAQCHGWSVEGSWTLTQGKNTVIYLSDMRQDGSAITGAARNDVSRNGKITTYRASLDGTLYNERFTIKVYWSGETVGIYYGNINQQGRIEGNTYDLRKPGSAVVRWFSNSTMRCIRR